MNTPLQRAALMAAACAVFLSTVLVGIVSAGPAGATSTPPWEPIGGSEFGGLTFYNSSGQVITGGNISDNPIAAYVQGNTALDTSPTKAELGGFTPNISNPPGAWPEVQFGNAVTPNVSAPGALATSTLPLYTGAAYSLSQLTIADPNTDISGDGYAGIYVLRLQAFKSPSYSTTYDSADISVDPNTGDWSVVYTPLAATTTTLATPTPAGPQQVGASVTLSATVADVSAPGTVQFYSGSAPVDSPVPVVDGAASLTTSHLPLGTDSLTAVFTPTVGAAFTGSTSNAQSYTINSASPTTTTLSTPSPAGPQPFGTEVTLGATVTSGGSGTIAGTVQFYSGSTAIGSPQTVSSGAVSLTTSLLPVGAPDSLTAVYTPTGGNGFAGSTSSPVSYTVTADATTTTLSTPSPAGPQPFGTEVTLGATVMSGGSGTITGTVQFYSGSTAIGSPQTVSSGAVSLTTSLLPVGAPDSLTAVYTPTGGNGFAGSTSSPVSYTVTADATTTMLSTPSPAGPQFAGTSVTLGATVTSGASGTITGTVQFYSGSTAIGSPQTVSSGAVSLTTSTLPVGAPDSLTATYTPTANNGFAGSTSSPVSYTVEPLSSTTTVLTSPSPASPQLFGTSVTLGATVSSGGSGTITGTVQFYSGGTAIGAPQTVSSDAASLTTSTLPVGAPDSLTATYTPTANNGFAGSTSAPVSYTVESTITTPPTAPAGTTSSQGASSGTPTGTATGTVSGLSASGNGEGALTVATYSGNPVVGAVSGGTGVYYDVALSSGNEFGSVTITVTDLGPGGQSIDWWNGSAWVPFSDQTYDAAAQSVTATVNATTSPTGAQLIGTQIAASSLVPPSQGYWEVGSDGGVFAFGGARSYGSLGGTKLGAPIVGMVGTPSGNGYWLVGSDGGVFAFGDAQFLGSLGGTKLGAPIVGMVGTPSGNGYWLVGSDGGVFAFGDAQFLGSLGGTKLGAPIVGMVGTPSGNGYWLVGSDGGVFAFGDAQFLGSLGGTKLGAPIVGMVGTPSGNGYWLVGSDGGVFAFGDAGFHGSLSGRPLNKPIVGIAASASGNGYWLAGADGGVFGLGDALFGGSAGDLTLNRPVVAIARA